MNTAEFLAARRADGMAHEGVLARGAWSQDEVEAVPIAELDEDRAMRMSMAGYQAGAILETAAQADALLLEIDVERQRIAADEAGRRRLMDLHAQGRITVEDLMRSAADDTGNPERLARLQERLAAVTSAGGQAAERSQAAHGLAARMDTGDEWQARRAQSMQLAADEAALERHRIEVEPEFRALAVRHHTRMIERAQVRQHQARADAAIARHTRSGTGWPEISRTTADAFDPVA